MSSDKTLSKMGHFSLSAISAAILAVSASAPASAGINENIENALKFGQDDAKYGQVKLDIRLRYENADTQHTTKKTANAFTTRFRIGYLSPKFQGLQGYAEFEANQDIGLNDYSNKRNGSVRKGGFDTIQDPQDTELNQLWLRYDGIPDTSVKFGRQRIKLNNDRFIGNVGWRQMEQTFDSVLLTNKSIANTTVKIGYIDQVKTIISTTDDMSTPFINIDYDIAGIGKLTAYSIWMDYNEAAKVTKSNQTYGIRLNGGRKVTEDIKVLYTVEYARQSDYDRNTNNYEADYYHIIGGASAYGLTFKGAIEQLDGRGESAFQTPLATKHGFNGWADIFLTTPAQGLRDVYGSAAATVQGVKFMGVYHNFSDDTGNKSYGNEYDLIMTKKIGKHYSLLAKYANYNADQQGNDTQKIWIQGGIHF